MNYLAVDLYHDFECIADACPNTCCAGWRITIDQATCKKMIEHQDALGVPASDWLIEQNGSTVAKLYNQRCAMLNEDNLCNVVLKLGPEYLSDTCKLYPRKCQQYGSVLELHLTASCPDVVAKLMDKEFVQFDFSEDTTPAPYYPYTQLYLFESAVRSSIFDLLQGMPEVKLITRIFAAFHILDKAIQLYSNEQPDFDLLKPHIGSYFQREILLSLDERLHNIVNETKRYAFLQQLQTVMCENVSNDRFGELIMQSYRYFQENNLEKYLSDITEFRANIQEYHAFYTNYWVYRMFPDLLTIPEYDASKEKMLYIAMEFCCIQILALASFVSNKKLDRDEYIYIISGISRLMEHNTSFRQQAIDKLRQNDLVSAAGLLLLILI
ncbi:MAG: flagellin lysine-N-methylase [Lachnospiraceae bacterium]|nr:flagellin lysine-N-methylase [Lachnospiraceae bacterium]